MLNTPKINNLGAGVFGLGSVVGTAVVDQDHNKLIFENTAVSGT